MLADGGNVAGPFVSSDEGELNECEEMKEMMMSARWIDVMMMRACGRGEAHLVLERPVSEMGVEVLIGSDQTARGAGSRGRGELD